MVCKTGICFSFKIKKNENKEIKYLKDPKFKCTISGSLFIFESICDIGSLVLENGKVFFLIFFSGD